MMTVLCLLVLQDSPYADPARKAAQHLVSLQGADGAFHFQATEQQIEGLQAMIGFALLSQDGFSGPVEKLTRHLLGKVGPDGAPGARDYKSDFENGYLAAFLAEVLLQDKYGKIKLEAGLREQLRKAVESEVLYFQKCQDPSGVWVYTGGPYKNYKETAALLGVIQFLKMAEALGVSVNGECIKRAMGFVRSRFMNGGFKNGDLEKDASIHLTPAVVAMLHWLPDQNVKDMIDAGIAYDAKREASGYITQWKYDEYDSIPPNLVSQAKMLVERRQMYGIFHLCLGYLRSKNSKFADVHKKVCDLLVAHASGDHWSSTIGTGGATAFALLTFNLAKKDALIFFRPAPGVVKGGAPAAVWFGAQLEKADKGVKVKAVQGDSTASTLGLIKGDVITSINDTEISEPDQVRSIVEGLQPNAEVTAKFVRGGKEQSKKGKVKKIPSAVAKWDEKKRSEWY
jgi:hypothetical protein